jgi:hypothetical protein
MPNNAILSRQQSSGVLENKEKFKGGTLTLAAHDI